MDRINSANFQTIGGRRTWRDKNLGAGLPGTSLIAIWLAGVQESIIALLEAVGIIPADSTLGSVDLQMLQAVKRMAGANTLAVSSGATVLTADNAGLVLVDATAGNVTLTLPAATAANGIPLQFEIVRLDATTHTVTVALAGADTLVTWGTPPLSIGAHYSVSLMSDGVSKWAQMNPPSDRSTLLCLSGVQSVANASEAAVVWPAAISDTALAATTGGFTIPAGVSKVEINFLVTFAANASGTRKARVLKNGTVEGVGLSAGRVLTPSGSDVAIISGAGGPISVAAGDTFALMVFQDSGGALNLSPASNNWMSLKVLT